MILLDFLILSLSVARSAQSTKKATENGTLAHLARWAIALLGTLDFLLLQVVFVVLK